MELHNVVIIILIKDKKSYFKVYKDGESIYLESDTTKGNFNKADDFYHTACCYLTDHPNSTIEGEYREKFLKYIKKNNKEK